MSATLNPSTDSPYVLFNGEDGIRGLHPESLDGSRDKLYWFLCGRMGSPNHYVKRFGHPRLRARHMPFPTGSPERDAWIACMRMALRDCEIDPKLANWLMGQL